MLPEIVGRYELLRPLGAGGMGEVFLGRDRTLDRQVAVKRVRAGDAQAARYILHEARVIASLDHPNIATVYDIVEHGGEPHIIMEYVEGATLSSRLAAGPLGEAQAIDYGRQIADALAYAHQRHVLHCDIKPGNVMITPNGVPKVLDFGIARRDSQTSAGATTTTHAIQGTPPYMAPEVLLGSPPSQQSDVFSLGVMLYELVAGKRPYEGRGAAAVLTAMTMPPPALEHHRRARDPHRSAAAAAVGARTEGRARSPRLGRHHDAGAGTGAPWLVAESDGVDGRAGDGVRGARRRRAAPRSHGHAAVRARRDDVQQHRRRPERLPRRRSCRRAGGPSRRRAGHDGRAAHGDGDADGRHAGAGGGCLARPDARADRQHPARRRSPAGVAQRAGRRRAQGRVEPFVRRHDR
jgi:hypothetical protein